jgi:cleavage stimulation factor subunit 3
MCVSVLLAFALADVQEDRNQIPTTHTLYETLLNRLNTDIDKLKLTVAAEVDNARGPEINTVASVGDVDLDGEIARLVEEREDRGKMVAERRGKEVDELCTSASMDYVHAVRQESRGGLTSSSQDPVEVKADSWSKGIKAARAVFGKARRSTHITWHIFEASGEPMLECDPRNLTTL